MGRDSPLWSPSNSVLSSEEQTLQPCTKEWGQCSVEQPELIMAVVPSSESTMSPQQHWVG